MISPRLLSFFFVGIFLLAGCRSVWDGSLHSSLAIPVEKYHPVRQVSGSAKTFVFLGLIGGWDHKNLVKEAKADLIRKNPTGPNEVLGDWMVSIRTNWVLVGYSQICQVEATVISLVPVASLPAVEQIGSNMPKWNAAQGSSGFVAAAGDSIEFNLDGYSCKGKVLRVNGNSVKIEYLDPANQQVKKINRFQSSIRPLR